MPTAYHTHTHRNQAVNINPYEYLSMNELPPQGLSRFKDIAPLLPFNRSTIWRKVKEGTFPKPIRLSHKCTVWRNQDVLDWINAQAGETMANTAQI